MNDILEFFIKNPEIHKKFLETYNSSKFRIPEFHSEDFDFIAVDVLKQTYENVLKDTLDRGLYFTNPFGDVFSCETRLKYFLPNDEAESYIDKTKSNILNGQ